MLPGVQHTAQQPAQPLCAQIISALSELAIPHFTSAAIFAAAEAKQQGSFTVHLQQLLVRAGSGLAAARCPRLFHSRTWCTMQAVSLSYGICAGLRGFFFSLLNTELIQKLRRALIRAALLVHGTLATS